MLLQVDRESLAGHRDQVLALNDRAAAGALRHARAPKALDNTAGEGSDEIPKGGHFTMPELPRHWAIQEGREAMRYHWAYGTT